MIHIELSLGEARDAVQDRLREWESADAVDRLWTKDTTLWASDPPPPELADRLGWLDLHETSQGLVPELAELRGGVPFWISDVVLLGMGGSSLAPEVLARTLGAEGLPLTLLDTTHPTAIGQLDWLNPANAIFIVASKSGTTLETLSLFHHFWSRTQEVVESPGDHFIAITDPGSSLVELARERGFRRVFEAPPDVGGRFSALSAFGLVPAALMGIDPAMLLERATRAADACVESIEHNPGFQLGAALAEMTRAGRDKVTFVTSPVWSAFPDWAEQLIAESTGKDGVGIVPITHEPAFDPADYGSDRVFVGLLDSPEAVAAAGEWGEDDDAPERLEALEAAGHAVIRVELDAPEQIGGLFLIWEIAVAMAGSALGIHPFNQPDVQVAKELAQRAMAGEDIYEGADEEEVELDLAWDTPPWGHAGSALPASVDVEELQARLDHFLEQSGPGDYVGIQVYTAGGSEEELETLQTLREALTGATGAATTLGYGPRFLHSTGQLHKGGANNGVFLQLVDDAASHLAVPERDFTFGQLIRAQADGDLGALSQRGRRVLSIRLGPSEIGLHRLLQLVDNYADTHGETA
jgi:transaldolase/glucose-6-phosphate isomerase